MCDFCVQHGEGKKWYVQAKNYAEDLLSDVRRLSRVHESVPVRRHGLQRGR